MIVTGDWVGQWVAEGAGVHLSPVSQAIGWVSGEELVAGILYDSFTGASIAMHSRVTDPKKVTREWLFVIFDYPFRQLGVKRVTGMVSEANIQAQKANEHLGWKRETTLADYFPDGAGIVYIMRQEDCRWLGYGKRLFRKDDNAIRSLHDATGTSLPETRAQTPDA